VVLNHIRFAVLDVREPIREMEAVSDLIAV